jgi:hypothetical protein
MDAVRRCGWRAFVTCRVVHAAWLCALGACSAEPVAGDAGSTRDGGGRDDRAEVTRVPRPSLCDRPREDAVRDVFCAGSEARIGGLQALLDALGIDPTQNVLRTTELDPRPYYYVPAAILAHSTALSGHIVSPINPRVLLVGADTIAAYQRGVQRVELAARSRETDVFGFYLVSFQQACNAEEDGCSPGDLYTPRVESSWTDVTLQDDEDLKDTPFDCRQCHQRGRTEPVLLMRELESPWTHFFEPTSNLLPPERMPEVRGSEYVDEYVAAKGEEPYGGAPFVSIGSSSGVVLQEAVPPEQPLLFDAPKIQAERWPYGPVGYPEEPQPSPTWERAYAAFKRGEQLALPHYSAQPTDADKQAQLTEAYASYRAGELSADDLPDLADIFPDDPHERALIGLQTEPDATPAETLVQACGPCHNDVLDQSISRARFNVRLAGLPRSEIDAAIERISLAAGEPGAMPPKEARQIDAGVRERLVEFLRQDERSAHDDELLDHAARMGMAGGAVAPLQ